MRIGAIHFDPTGKIFDLAPERDSPAAVPLADFEAKKIVTPPGGFGGVRMLAPPGESDQAVPSEEQQVAVRDVLAGVGKGHELWLFGWRHE